MTHEKHFASMTVLLFLLSIYLLWKPIDLSTFWFHSDDALHISSGATCDSDFIYHSKCLSTFTHKKRCMEHL